MEHIVYLLTDPLTGLKYIGSKYNWKGEGTYFGSPRASKYSKKFLKQIEWKKNSKERPETFILTILFSSEDIPHKVLLKIEKYFQLKYDVVSSDEFINAGLATTGKWGLFSFPGEKNGMYGRKQSKSAKEKIGNANRGRKMPDGFSEKISLATRGENNPMYGKMKSEESIKSSIEKLKGKSTYEKTDEVRRKMSIAAKNRKYILDNPILQISLDGKLVREYPSYKDAMKVTGFSKKIIKCLKGESFSSFGFIWRFKE